MNSTGITRRVDEQGRIVIPKELRDSHNIDVGTALEIFTDHGDIVIRKYHASCFICNGTGDFEVKGTAICKRCANLIIKKLDKELI